jgi:hypothetical protein
MSNVRTNCAVLDSGSTSNCIPDSSAPEVKREKMPARYVIAFDYNLIGSLNSTLFLRNRVMVAAHWCVKAKVAGSWLASSAGVSAVVNTTHPASTPRFPNTPTGSKRI